VDSVGIRELRNQVAAVVRRAAAGERVVVTVDGRPVAQLGPLEPEPGRLTLDDLAAAGLLDPPRRPERPAAAPDAVAAPVDVRLDRVLDELRGR
jgi:prevent-host-death family protein